ncbi:SWIM zinc finger domain-containing protein [Phytophthora infestans]|uniref:SWIM zinc finger domain-containing protein n=1 Tax=Phytophthora infestans TaxID=4787 RepID=A0A8S9V4I1_PHYIN|nr:SWIM zinc finger domain-containing protein [Phytophthora infestans]
MVLRFTTHHAAKAVEPQYAAGLHKADTYRFKPDPVEPGVVTVSDEKPVHQIQLLDWTCNCEFALSMRLPCRHVIAYRKHTGVKENVIPWNRIIER